VLAEGTGERIPRGLSAVTAAKVASPDPHGLIAVHRCIKKGEQKRSRSFSDLQTKTNVFTIVQLLIHFHRGEL
jgi:hypothetical protein